MNFESKLLAPKTWQIRTPMLGCTAYLLAGEKEGVMIDSGESTENLREYAESLCDVPVRTVLNTHGHFDHTGGNSFFNVAIMGKLAAEIAKIPNGPSSEESIGQFSLDYSIVTVDTGFTIDIGGREIEAFRMDGHSPDCIAWLDKKERILFTGDNMAMVPMKYKCADPQPSMLLYMESVAKILARREDFDYICTGHGDGLMSGDLVNYTMMAALRALDGELDEPPQHPKRPGKSPFDGHNPEDNGFIEYKGARIMFNKRYLKDTTRYDIVQGT